MTVLERLKFRRVKTELVNNLIVTEDLTVHGEDTDLERIVKMFGIGLQRHSSPS